MGLARYTREAAQRSHRHIREHKAIIISPHTGAVRMAELAGPASSRLRPRRPAASRVGRRPARNVGQGGAETVPEPNRPPDRRGRSAADPTAPQPAHADTYSIPVDTRAPRSRTPTVLLQVPVCELANYCSDTASPYVKIGF